MKLLIIIAILLLNCGYRCIQTDNTADAAEASARGARVTRNEYGVWEWCERERD